MINIYTIENVDDIAMVRFSQSPDILDIKKMIDELCEKDIYSQRLLNFSKNGFCLSNTESAEVASYSMDKFTKPSSLAIVVDADFAHDIGKVFGSDGNDQKSNTKVFGEESEAIAWLKSQG